MRHFTVQMKDTGSTFNGYLSDHLIHQWTAGGTTVRKKNGSVKMQQRGRDWTSNCSILKKRGLSRFWLPTHNLSTLLLHTPPSCTSACWDTRCCANPPATAAPAHRGNAESCGPLRGRSPWRGWRTAGSLCCKTGNPCRGEQTQWKSQQCSTTTHWITAGS